MTIYAAPGANDALITYKDRYDNFIGSKFVAPVKGQYFDVITPINGKVYTKAARSTAEDIELALDAAHAAAEAWGKTDVASRANVLLKIADRIDQLSPSSRVRLACLARLIRMLLQGRRTGRIERKDSGRLGWTGTEIRAERELFTAPNRGQAGQPLNQPSNRNRANKEQREKTTAQSLIAESTF